MTDQAINAIVRKLDDILPADYNPRIALGPDDAEYQQLKASIERFGLVVPLVWNRRTGTLVGGHQRLQVLRDLGYDEAPIIELDLDFDQEQALNVALNKIDGRWDDEKLIQLLDGLTMHDFPIDDIGFAADDYDDLLRRLDQAASADFIGDMLDDDADYGADADIDLEQHIPDTFAGRWFTLTYVVTEQDRKLIASALAAARDEFDVDTSPQALHRIATHYIDQHSEPDPEPEEQPDAST